MWIQTWGWRRGEQERGRMRVSRKREEATVCSWGRGCCVKERWLMS